MSKFDAIRRALKTGDELGLQRAYSRALVKGLDTSPEARLARARAQGFDVETPLYRGLQEPFDPAKASKYGGEFYTPDPDIARNYALWTGRVDDGPNTMPVFAKPPTVTEDWGGATYSDPAKRLTGETEQVQEFRYGPAAILDLFAPKYVTQDVTRPDWRPTHRSADKFVKAAAAEGAPVVRVDNVYDSGGKQSQTYVADPTARRSVFAMFDPARAGRSDIMAGVVPAAAAVGAGAIAASPKDAQAAEPSALARALARQLQGSYNKREAAQAQQALGDRLDRVISNEQRRALQATGGRVDRSGEFVRQMATPEGLNYLADTALDAAGWVDPSGGFATETVRALKDLPSKVGIGGAISLAPVVGASEMNGGIGQLPFVAYEAAKSSPRALARAIARKPQPRGSQTYRKAK